MGFSYSLSIEYQEEYRNIKNFAPPNFEVYWKLFFMSIIYHQVRIKASKKNRHRHDSNMRSRKKYITCPLQGFRVYRVNHSATVPTIERIRWSRWFHTQSIKPELSFWSECFHLRDPVDQILRLNFGIWSTVSSPAKPLRCIQTLHHGIAGYMSREKWEWWSLGSSWSFIVASSKVTHINLIVF